MFKWLQNLVAGPSLNEQKHECPLSWEGPPKYNPSEDGYAPTSGDHYDPELDIYYAHKYVEKEYLMAEAVLTGHWTDYYPLACGPLCPGTVIVNIRRDNKRVQSLIFLKNGECRELSRKPAAVHLVKEGYLDHATGRMSLKWGGQNLALVPPVELEITAAYEYDPYTASAPAVQTGADSEADFILDVEANYPVKDDSDRGICDEEFLAALEEVGDDHAPRGYFKTASGHTFTLTDEGVNEVKGEKAEKSFKDWMNKNDTWPSLNNPYVPQQKRSTPPLDSQDIYMGQRSTTPPPLPVEDEVVAEAELLDEIPWAEEVEVAPPKPTKLDLNAAQVPDFPAVNTQKQVPDFPVQSNLPKDNGPPPLPKKTPPLPRQSDNMLSFGDWANLHVNLPPQNQQVSFGWDFSKPLPMTTQAPKWDDQPLFNPVDFTPPVSIPQQIVITPPAPAEVKVEAPQELPPITIDWGNVPYSGTFRYDYGYPQGSSGSDLGSSPSSGSSSSSSSVSSSEPPAPPHAVSNVGGVVTLGCDCIVCKGKNDK